ncbi:MAG TPA: glycosyl transferase [Lachnospiraceae bacterium]|mgnify:CR=1 FL=1|nr:glycosyl transferase [Lachnospiraceae bacterium]
MIPKVIHYCWFGRNPLPPLAVKCIESWKSYLPDYEIREWNEDNFDVDIIPYTREAYEARKYAFVSDYARFYILYHHGGLYFDTDVEVIRPMDDIVARGAFMGCENEAKPGMPELAVAPGLGLGCPSGLRIYAEILDLYAGLHFKCADGGLNLKTVVAYTTEQLVAKGLKNVNEVQCVADVWVYPKEYFCPMDYYTSQLNITLQTRSIHHYAASWLSWRIRVIDKIIAMIAKVIGLDRTRSLLYFLCGKH